eukprot:TRINITY_DN21807_c0_g1_i1.p2 TRINITY_DN21807_c0_g1~~TRINITY_DN21807_c0_g1_i1.p2  ORF type:complete len:217 (+),score=28.41 TRINITY_DN21807_c0_g1_i1:92-742(+)
MQRGLVGSEMCIRDSINAEYMGYQKALLDAHLEAGNDKFAEHFLLDKLNKQFSLPLLVYLEKLQISDHYPLILLLEKKLAKEPEKGLLHQALARLKLKENNTLAAIRHLIESVKTVPNIEDFALLAELLQKEDRAAEANEYYRQGLLLALSEKQRVIKVKYQRCKLLPAGAFSCFFMVYLKGSKLCQQTILFFLSASKIAAPKLFQRPVPALKALL